MDAKQQNNQKKSPLLEGMSFLSGVVGDSNLFYCFIGQRTPGFSGIGFGSSKGFWFWFSKGKLDSWFS
jgi:hypothetical protein